MENVICVSILLVMWLYLLYEMYKIHLMKPFEIKYKGNNSNLSKSIILHQKVYEILSNEQKESEIGKKLLMTIRSEDFLIKLNREQLYKL